MKRLGFRSASVSIEENAGARTKASQTTEPQLFYIVCCAVVHFTLYDNKKLQFNNPWHLSTIIFIFFFIFLV